MTRPPFREGIILLTWGDFRLEKTGHNVVMTANGEECFHSFSKSCADYDAILMDMQVCCRSHHRHHHDDLASDHSLTHYT